MLCKFFKSLFSQKDSCKKEITMFCNQCEQTAQGSGCTKIGVCGKNGEIAALQDLLTYTLQGLSIVAQENPEALTQENKQFIVKCIFTCLTNVDFDPDRFPVWIQQTVLLRDALLEKLANKSEVLAKDSSVSFQPAMDLQGLIEQGYELDFINSLDENEDLRSLKQTILYGLRGLAAYTDHAAVLEQEDDAVYSFIFASLAEITRKDLDLDSLVALAMECGSINLKAMELLDAGNTQNYGHPVPTSVPLGHKKGKAILVTGHDLKDLHMLLEQTKDKGIFIYTHGEMLPCHGYPTLKAYDHFYGHYGTAWQNQQKEMDDFPGAILFTTNCIQKPKDSYKENVFTTGLVGWPDVTHIDEEKDFTPLIERALELQGFENDEEKDSVLVGFGHNAVLGVADKVIEGVKSGAIRHFFLVGGCDGAKSGRNYYTELAEEIPQDCVILTLACGKFRFFDKKLGNIDGIPRLLDIGQCNDAYSAIQIAIALAQAFECEVNDLPLSMVLSWYEQKAVIILLTLLALGITDIRLGPSLPAFLSPNVVNFLVEKFAIKPITTAKEDIQAILG